MSHTLSRLERMPRKERQEESRVSEKFMRGFDEANTISRIRMRIKLFTLIELLVVIAIISILFAMGAAALSRSKNSALGTQCKNLMKQYGLATELYANEWDDFYPDARKHLDPQGGILIYFSKEKNIWPKDISRCPGDSKTEELGRLGYFSAYDCHASIGSTENTLSDSARPTTGGLKAFWRKRRTFKYPIKMMTWADFQNNPYDPALTAAMVKPITNDNMGSLCFRHNGASNAAYGDGHVGDLRLTGISSTDGGHNLSSGMRWGVVSASFDKAYKMYYPFGPPPENVGEGKPGGVTSWENAKDWPTVKYN